MVYEVLLLRRKKRQLNQLIVDKLCIYIYIYIYISIHRGHIYNSRQFMYIQGVYTYIYIYIVIGNFVHKPQPLQGKWGRQKLVLKLPRSAHSSKSRTLVLTPRCYTNVIHHPTRNFSPYYPYPCPLVFWFCTHIFNIKSLFSFTAGLPRHKKQDREVEPMWWDSYCMSKFSSKSAFYIHFLEKNLSKKNLIPNIF